MNAVSLRDTGSPLLRSSPPFLSRSVGEEGGWGEGEGAGGKVRGTNLSPFLSRAVGEEGGWGEGEGAKGMVRVHPSH
jgi:hypothetical protein